MHGDLGCVMYCLSSVIGSDVAVANLIHSCTVEVQIQHRDSVWFYSASTALNVSKILEIFTLKFTCKCH